VKPAQTREIHHFGATNQFVGSDPAFCDNETQAKRTAVKP